MLTVPEPRRYRCLVVDHDDTAVRSTPEIHHPAYCAMLGLLRPGLEAPTLDAFFLMLHRGFAEHLRGDLAFTEEEMREEYRIWRSYVDRRVPSFHPGFVEALRAYQAAGGLVAVVSHSDAEVIRRDYAAGAPGLRLDAVYGWHEDEKLRKPSSYPLLDLMERFGLERRELLVLDDLGPGVVMARRTGVDAAAAGWAHRLPEIEADMRRECTYYLESTAELGALLVSGAPGRERL
jgi:phosphoglycolate phosphatase-like HAD superfamily hydrolase